MIHVNLHVLLDIDVESRKQLPVVREERTTIQVLLMSWI